MVDMEAKLNDMKSKSEEYTDKVSCWLFLFFSAFSVQLIILIRSGNFQGPASHSSNKQKVQVVEGHFFNSSGKITPMEHEKQAFERVLSD